MSKISEFFQRISRVKAAPHQERVTRLEPATPPVLEVFAGNFEDLPVGTVSEPVRRMDEATLISVERELRNDKFREGLFIISVALANGRTVHELLGVNSREDALHALAAQYSIADLPQCRELGIDELGAARLVGRYFTRLEKGGRLKWTEHMCSEIFSDPDVPGVGELKIHDRGLWEKLASAKNETTDAARPRMRM
jgi:hypothetical protein